MAYAFLELVNLSKLQELMESFYETTDIPSFIVAPDGKCIVRAGHQDLCRDFHHKHPITKKRCLKSSIKDMTVTEGFYQVEECRNGLLEACAPIIVKDQHIANILAGQFFFEPPDDTKLSFFKNQAKEYGFDETLYLSAVLKIPIIEKKRLKAILNYLTKLSAFIADMGVVNLERRRFSHELKEHLHFSQHLMDTIPNPVFYKNLQGFYQGCNTAFEKCLGIHRDKIVNQHPDEVAPFIQGKKKKAYSGDVYDRSDVVVYETKLKYADEYYRDVIVTETPYLDKEGALAGTLGIILDISERKEAENALRQSEARFRALVDSNIDAILVIDSTGKLRFSNPAARALFKWRTLNNSSLIPGIPTSEQGSAVIQILDENGAIKHAEMRHVNTLWEGEDVYLITLRDISQQLAMQHERQKLERQLRRAQKMEAIGTLAGGIAHDFNNILSAVMGYTEIGIDDLEEGTLIKKNMGQVLTAARRAKELVRQILTFSRQVDHEYNEVQVDLIVREALKLLRASIPSTIDIQQKIQSEAKILADPTQIHQVLMNLCTNANHAMQEKGGTLEVQLGEKTLDAGFVEHHIGITPGDYICLTIRDTGYGMPAEIIERIFDPFFTTKKKGEGTGMGLAVVHGIVKSHNGTITVESKPNTGTTFQLYFPIIQSNKGKKEAETEEAAVKGHERILFVDDEQLIVNYASQMLKRLGYSVDTRTNSIEALELFKKRPEAFDVVITDLTMPNMTGDELVKEILAIREGIPIILCTGFSSKISEKDAKDLGVRAFLNKPIVRHQLSKTIRSVLDRS